MPTLNRNQKLVLAALAVAVALMQFLIFEEDGVRGYGWIISFVVVAVVLLLLFKDRPAPQAIELAQAPAGENSVFNDLIFELDKIYRRSISVPPAEDIATKLIQRDMIFGSIQLLAYGLIAMKRESVTPGYLSQPEHGELIALVVKRMVSSRTKIAGGMATGIPVPGLDLSPDFNAIKNKVLQEIQETLTTFAAGHTARPRIEAEARLVNHFVASAPYVKTAAQKETLQTSISKFTARYLP